MSVDLSTGRSVRVGEVELTTLLDGAGVVCPLDEAYSGPSPEDWTPYRTLYPELFAGTEWRLPVLCSLLRVAGRTMLVDAGAGAPGRWDSWTPDVEGRLPSSLEAAGVDPAEIDAVFLTHFDGDHIGWLDGATLADATLLATADSADFALERTSGEWLRLELEARDVEFVAPGDEVLPGVFVVAYPGHVPGHVGLDVASNGAHALLIADSVPHAALLDRLDWRFTFDHDAKLAAETRARLVESVVDTETLVVCGHFPGSGIGRVRRCDGRVVWDEL